MMWVFVGPYQGHPRAGWISGMLKMAEHQASPLILAVDAVAGGEPFEPIVTIDTEAVAGVKYRGIVFWLKHREGETTRVVRSAFLVRVDGAAASPQNAAEIYEGSKGVFPEVWRDVPDMGAIEWPRESSADSPPRSPEPSPTGSSRTARPSRKASTSPTSSA